MPTKKPRTINLYVFHLPILLVAIVLFAAVTIANPSKLFKPSDTEGSVLSSNSGSGGDRDKDDGEDEEDEDEDAREDRDDNGKDNESGRGSDRGRDDVDREEPNSTFSSRSGSSKSTPELKDGEKTKNTETVLNSDGTTSVVETEIEGDEIKKEIKTYDASGNKIKVEKYESEEGEEKSRVSVYDIAGNKVSDIRLETEDGKELELRVKEGETELSRVKFDVEKQELLVRTSESSGSADFDQAALKIKLAGENFTLTRKGVDATSKFPLVVDDVTGRIFVQTPAGEITLNVMPDTILEKAQASEDIDTITDIELTAANDANASDQLEFTLTGTKSQKLLGIFELQVPSVVVYDAQTGEFIKSEQSFITKVLDLFSF